MVFVPYEIYELTKSITWLKVLALVINLAIVIYLLLAKRLFGLRGGRKAEQAERDKDYGWPAIERATPHPTARIAPQPAPRTGPGTRPRTCLRTGPRPRNPTRPASQAQPHLPMIINS